MCPTRKFFIKFLKTRRLPEPNGQRLYKYGCRPREYGHLCEILRDCGDPKRLRVRHDGYGHPVAEIPDWEDADAAGVMACFVLYASRVVQAVGWSSAPDLGPIAG